MNDKTKTPALDIDLEDVNLGDGHIDLDSEDLSTSLLDADCCTLTIAKPLPISKLNMCFSHNGKNYYLEPLEDMTPCEGVHIQSMICIGCAPGNYHEYDWTEIIRVAKLGRHFRIE